MKSKDKNEFINSIRLDATILMKRYRIPASVLIAMVIKNTYWGQDALYKNYNVCFRIPVRDDLPWDDSTAVIDSTSSPNKPKYRAYDSVQAGLDDFCRFFITYRVVQNGPFKFAACLNKPFTECMNILRQLSGMDDSYYDSIMALIDKYRLQDIDDDMWVEINAERLDKEGPSEETVNDALEVVEDVYYVRIDWDDEETQLVSTKNIESAKQIASKQQDYKVFDKNGQLIYNSWPVYKGDGCYRVRKSWYDATDQKIVTKIYDKAVEMAKKYKGYKVFSSAGDMLEDPWADYVEPDKTAVALVMKPVLSKGQAITLEETPVFRDPYIKTSFARFNGIFYIFDDKTYGPSNRVRICQYPSMIGTPKGFAGYVEQSMIKH